ADADLRHRLLLEGGARPVPGAAGGRQAARPPAARPAARPLPLRGVLSRRGALAPEGDGALELARGPPADGERAARLPRGEDAAHVGPRALAALGPPGEVRGEHLPDRARRAEVRPEADELPRPHARLH